MIVNRIRCTLKVVAVKAPGYGDSRKDMLQDIAVMTGGQAVLDDLGMQLKDVTLDMLGQAASVKVTKDDTTIVGGLGDTAAIQERIAYLKRQMAETTSDFDRDKLMDRVAKMGGGVAVVKVGAATEAEMKEMKYRMEDALNATRAAVEEGIIAGGGSAYICARKAVKAMEDSLDGDEKTGARIVAKALEAPLRTIVENAGLEGSVVIQKVEELGEGMGFDAVSEQYVNMVEEGIIDPVKVTKSALQNAVSVAATLLTTEAAVADIKEPAVPAAAPQDMDY